MKLRPPNAAPNTYPEHTRAIYLTNVNASGADVMIFTSLTAAVIERAYRNAPRQTTWDELYEVPQADVGYYIYEPCWLTLDEEAVAREFANGNPKAPTPTLVNV